MRQRLFSFVFLFLIATSTVFAEILTPRGNAQLPVQILDHHVNVTIIDGFSRTEVTQTFFNPNSVDLEAVYSTPLPSTAALSEIVVRTGETTIEGEVLAALEAEQIYNSEVARGRAAALAVKDEIFDFRFYVSPVRAGQTVKIRFAYLQSLEIDTGVGR
jgi:Ca-activated chloride channel family protein